MQKRLQSQLKNTLEIREVLCQIPINFKLGTGEQVETLLIYLPSKNGACSHTELFDVIKNSIMTNFVFSCSEVEKKLSIKSDKAPEELFKKAIRKMSKHTAQGELGELILFTLLDVYLDAPKILSKISFKTNPRMPVFGADAVHAQYVDGELRLYLGESKLHQSFKSAATKAVDSISNALEKYSDEFDLIDSHIDFPDIDSDASNQLIAHLNPFSDANTDMNNILHSPCFIGFKDPDVFSDDPETYQKQYIELAKDYIGDFYTKLASKDNDIAKTALLLLPFSCVESLVKEFIAYMEITN